mmetsp:Transcript_3863/g.11172  ORF Transcript_3863/g.11172 Transcript_3863/m.11172 type:complete len:499 (-) Transcript_3863:1065-2561(-)|eukprot:CAMPEP_0206151782 /NCGR_PEP_ID=MMETSP1473-20131121/38993_1 /ASSEMBLY_ACC=CAM_ASM_001109 /TAXON_ID=1461547 /ORGANISM="Stichococcus sp, Strain RCC1054" /LENGTH=498 /DNA_ID=CAMNT_0053549329 /DNA_START=196 /DNA_END=1692 /DNA_ORIENTATION=+
MWLLRGEGDIDGQTYYLHEGTFLVGRAAPDIAIALLEQSVSRKHAAITVGPLDPSGPPDARPPVTITDSGKFGTHLSNSRAEEKSTTLAKGIPTPLAAGTLLRFGALLHLRLVWDPVVLCFPGEDALGASVMAAAARLGLHVRRRWHRDCTHLLTDTPPPASDATAACAAAQGRPAVQYTWLEACDVVAQGVSTEPWPSSAAHLWPPAPLPPALAAPLKKAGRLTGISGSRAAGGGGEGGGVGSGAARQQPGQLLAAWAFVLPQELQGGQLQLAIELAGGTFVAPGEAVAPGIKQQVQVTVAQAVPGAEAATEASISAELLTAAIVSAREETLRAYLEEQHVHQQQPQPQSTPVTGMAGTQPIFSAQSQRKRPGVGGRADPSKRARRGGAASAQMEAPEEAVFDPRPNPGDVLSPEKHQKRAKSPDTHITEVVAMLVVKDSEHAPAQRHQAHTTGSKPGPNFKGFRKRQPLAPRLPTIAFAADAWPRAADVHRSEYVM